MAKKPTGQFGKRYLDREVGKAVAAKKKGVTSKAQARGRKAKGAASTGTKP